MTNPRIPAVPTRRRLLKGALGLAAASAAGSVPAVSFPPHKLRLWLEGDVNLAWVHSLFPVQLPPLDPSQLAVRLRVVTPVSDEPPRSARNRSTTLLDVFLAPANVPAGQAAPRIANISVSEVLTESSIISVAQVADATTRLAKNVVLSGTFVSNEIASPFGLLTGRAGYIAFGYEWIDEDSDSAIFKLVTAGAAGSHVTVVPEAAGEISFG